jgi:hypothetical protein
VGGFAVTGTSAPTASKLGWARSTAPAPLSRTPKCSDVASSETSSTTAACCHSVLWLSARSCMLSIWSGPDEVSIRSHRPAQSLTSWVLIAAAHRTLRPV